MRYEIPDTHDHLDQRQFVLAVRRLANSLGYGSDASPFLGAGSEYVQSRPYVPGDPIKFIDWKVTGRTGKFHVKEYEAPKQLPVYILLDTSTSMCVSSRRMSKYAWGVHIAMGLGLVALERMSPVGLMGCGQRKIHVKPTLSKVTLHDWAYRLRRFDYRESTNLGRRVRALMPALKQRCVVLVISDLHDEDAVEALKLLGQEHDVIVLEMEDPAERGRLGGGFFRAMEAETGRVFSAHGRSRFLDVEHNGHELNRGQVDHLHIRIDEPFLPKLKNFLARRSCFGRGSR